MLDPASDLLPPASSPTISSISSSDLDTESTGSFFHDRSTTLGTLMGVNYPAITFRAPSQHREPPGPTVVPGGGRKQKKKKTPPYAVVERRRRWWSLCRDDGARPASLGDFLDLERRYGDGAFYSGAAAEVEGVAPPGNGRVLFADGRVLPPADADEGTSTAGNLCRFPVSLTGICSGGVG